MSELMKVDESGALSLATQDRFLAMVENLASMPDTDIVKLDKIMAMQIQWRDYQAKQEFSRALATAQGKIGSILRDKERANGPIKGNYASFDQMVLQSKDVLATYGLSISLREVLGGDANIVHLEGKIRHVGGHHELYDLTCPYDTSSNKSPVWAKGSAITYCKKYLYAMMLCLGTGEDDDGLVATTYLPQGISATQKAHLTMLIEQADSSVDVIFRRYNVACLDDLGQQAYEDACEGLTKKIESIKALDAQVISEQPENFLNV